MEIKLLMIAFIVCFIVDISGIVEQFKKMLWRIIFGKKSRYSYFSLKPIDCSLCMVWWSSLTYLFITKDITIYSVFYSTLLSLFSQNITQLMVCITDLIGGITNWISDLFYKK